MAVSNKEIIAELNQKIAELKAQVSEQEKVLIEQKEKIAALQTENEQYAAVNKNLVEKVEELSEQAIRHPERHAELVSASLVSKKTFLVAGQTYGFVMPKLKTKNGVITADEVLASIELQEALVAKKSGFIKQIAQ